MSTRFAVAVHILVILAFHKGKPVSSGQIAKSVNTSAAVIRQIMMRLKEAGLVDAVLGKGGGSILAKDASSISLLDVYKATEKSEIVCTHRNEPADECFVGRNILPALCAITNEAQGAFFSHLEKHSIMELQGQIKAMA